MEKKKEYAVSYYGGHVTAWLCVAAAILGIMYRSWAAEAARRA